MVSTLSLLTTGKIAKRFKCTKGRIRQIAVQRRIKPAMVLGRTILFTPAQARMLEPVGDRARARGAKLGAAMRRAAKARARRIRARSRR